MCRRPCSNFNRRRADVTQVSIGGRRWRGASRIGFSRPCRYVKRMVRPLRSSSGLPDLRAAVDSMINCTSARASRVPLHEQERDGDLRQVVGRVVEGFLGRCSGNPRATSPRTPGRGVSACAWEVHAAPERLPPAHEGKGGLAIRRPRRSRPESWRGKPPACRDGREFRSCTEIGNGQGSRCPEQRGLPKDRKGNDAHIRASAGVRARTAPAQPAGAPTGRKPRRSSPTVENDWLRRRGFPAKYAARARSNVSVSISSARCGSRRSWLAISRVARLLQSRLFAGLTCGPS